jgi:hypothetical protein|tara:strand:+ start:668 stop:856 length:189 start_codon:yes stop_codon:yes gene_type:complete
MVEIFEMIFNSSFLDDFSGNYITRMVKSRDERIKSGHRIISCETNFNKGYASYRYVKKKNGK